MNHLFPKTVEDLYQIILFQLFGAKFSNVLNVIFISDLNT